MVVLAILLAMLNLSPAIVQKGFTMPRVKVVSLPMSGPDRLNADKAHPAFNKQNKKCHIYGKQAQVLHFASYKDRRFIRN